MKHYLVLGFLIVFTLSSYGQEPEQKLEKETDSITQAANAAKDAATLLMIEKAQKEAQNAGKATKIARKGNKET